MVYSSRWFEVEHPVPDALVRMFCFPYAGGGASVFHGWSNELPLDVEVVSVRLPGRETRIDEIPVGSLDELLKSLYQNIKPLLNKPFVFFGHSNGALICYKLALLLHHKDSRMLPAMLILSAKCPPHVLNNDKNLSKLPYDELVAALVELGGTPKELLKNHELMELLLPMLRADFSLGEGLNFQKDTLLECPVCVFYGSEDKIPLHQITAWQDLFYEQVNIHEFSGGHFFIHEQRAKVLSVLSGLLKLSLSRV